MSLAAQIALSVAAGLLIVALLYLLRRRRPLNWVDTFWAAICFVIFSTMAFDLLHSGEPREGQTVRMVAMVTVCLAGLAYGVWELIVNWRDEEKLADLYGSQQGYIARPERVAPRTKAVLILVLGGGLFLAVAIFYLQSLFSPE